MQTIINMLAHELRQPESYVSNVVKLLDEGNTVPFIARYRKELHGAMDDQMIRTLADRLGYLRSLDEKRAEIRASIESQGKLTETLDHAIAEAQTLAALDDLYRPYRPKRRTRASVAREKGLEPLAAQLLAARTPSPDLDALAAPFVAPAKGIETAVEALSGASDIIAEEYLGRCGYPRPPAPPDPPDRCDTNRRNRRGGYRLCDVSRIFRAGPPAAKPPCPCNQPRGKGG